MSSKRSRCRSRSGDLKSWVLVNELPDPFPVTRADIDAIERYGADVVQASRKQQKRLKHEGNQDARYRSAL